MAGKSTAAKAQESEAKDKEIVVEYDGETYTLPPAREWDTETFEHFENMRMVTGVRSALGPDNWKRFLKGGDGGKRKIGEVTDMYDAMMTAVGNSPEE
jgi:hypothetical protein